MQAATTAEYEAMARRRKALIEDLARVGKEPTRRRTSRTRRGGIIGAVGGLIAGAIQGTFGDNAENTITGGELSEAQIDEINRELAELERQRQQAIDDLQVEPLPAGRYGIPPRRLPGGEPSIEAARHIPFPLPFPDWQGVVNAPPPPSTPVRGNRVRRVIHRIQSMTGNRYAQLGVLGLSLLGQRSRSSRSVPAALVDPTPPATIPDVIPPAIPGWTPADIPFGSPLTSINSGVPSSAPGRSDRCDCKPKKRGPRRECLERAPIKWAGGRRKGKAAGTKCVRWRT